MTKTRKLIALSLAALMATTATFTAAGTAVAGPGYGPHHPGATAPHHGGHPGVHHRASRSHARATAVGVGIAIIGTVIAAQAAKQRRQQANAPYAVNHTDGVKSRGTARDPNTGRWTREVTRQDASGRVTDRQVERPGGRSWVEGNDPDTGQRVRLITVDGKIQRITLP